LHEKISRLNNQVLKVRIQLSCPENFHFLEGRAVVAVSCIRIRLGEREQDEELNHLEPCSLQQSSRRSSASRKRLNAAEAGGCLPETGN